MNVEELLSELREAGRGESCPPEMEKTLRAAARARRGRQPVRGWLAVGALAAAAMALIVFVHAPQVSPIQSSGGFLALDPDAVHGVPDGYLIRVQVPREAVGRLGVSFDPALLPETVDADLLLGNDGMARAIRFVPASQTIGNRRNQ